ncbi:MAG: AbrB/MazE/SpoVT family DNA-binding domain-containing protein [Macrococcus canis]|uniref:AbrB/MazE/SpoVT family DNA-binding domain-containing protein n=1 Tax=Macrococcoides canis TaxID=1855823 RepID=A0A4R6C767_9STAP|nr:AbrB/MazE/SpoVT family DNA-binding domain-containing protein [Macrococcus canis]MCO4095523.1 AbrB/MazE/SpoVT family DNA-binding domain-containing protein [Macrococcus canis]MEE1107518.1 AbrB/MazE/SpoVT family DNA-binding domain-containing protein [Macrococcus canis]QIH78548.1 AbrB/MazE/SpoVT family DNA-binding domain-containing protein [Macrococcus canis]QTQ07181.1 AbrB/MazE/SpoVT family DNA-binding domain-containing protein [Macrococcus canis]TDM18353.1 AbrB/MazE/SpoVT family DNA-binding d
MQVSLQRWGNSQGIRIPKSIVNEMNLDKNQKFDLTMQDEKIILTKQQQNVSLIRELFENYKTENKPSEFDWGKPRGNEVW